MLLKVSFILFKNMFESFWNNHVFLFFWTIIKIMPKRQYQNLPSSSLFLSFSLSLPCPSVSVFSWNIHITPYWLIFLAHVTNISDHCIVISMGNYIGPRGRTSETKVTLTGYCWVYPEAGSTVRTRLAWNLRGNPRSHCIAQATPELVSLLPLFWKYWDQRGCWDSHHTQFQVCLLLVAIPQPWERSLGSSRG